MLHIVSKVPSRISVRLMIFLAILCDLMNSAFATTLVVLRAPDYVILGSDSSATEVKGDQTTQSSACKVRQFGEVSFAAAGAVGDGNGFDAFEVAARAVKRRTDVVAIANDFESVTRRPFTQYLQRFYGENPAQFTRHCAKKVCLTVVFAAMDRGTPKISVRGLFVTVKKKVVVVEPSIQARMDCPGTCVTGGEQVVLGVSEEANSVFDRTPHFWKVNGIVSGMEQLIGAEISAHADIVGPPISILQLDGQGVRFLPGHQGLCGNPEK
jgi:hypothetical protein